MRFFLADSGPVLKPPVLKPPVLRPPARKPPCARPRAAGQKGACRGMRPYVTILRSRCDSRSSRLTETITMIIIAAVSA